MYEGQFEIESYQIGIWCSSWFEADTALFFSNGTQRHIYLKTKPQAHGNRYTIALWFSDEAVASAPGVVGGIIKATEEATGKEGDLFLIGLPESYYADIYAILRGESPVFFTYFSDVQFPRRPFPRPLKEREPITVRGVNISTQMEPVGEGIDRDAAQTQAGLKAIFKRYEGASGKAL